MKRAGLLLAIVVAVGVPLTVRAQSAAPSGTAAPEDFGLPSGQPAPEPLPPPTITIVPPPAPTATQAPGQPAPPPAQGELVPVQPQQHPGDLVPVSTPVPEDEEKKAQRFRPSGKFGLGYHYASVHGVPIQAGRLRAGMGAQNADLGHYAMLSIMVGETETGRRAWDLRLGWSGDFRVVSRLRLGIDLELGYLFIRRATIDQRMYALGIGAGAHAGVDVVQWGKRDDHALTVDARIEGHLHFGNAVLWGPSISGGLRF